jgi:hypothetical protein
MSITSSLTMGECSAAAHSTFDTVIGVIAKLCWCSSLRQEMQSCHGSTLFRHWMRFPGCGNQTGIRDSRTNSLAFLLGLMTLIT